MVKYTRRNLVSNEHWNCMKILFTFAAKENIPIFAAERWQIQISHLELNRERFAIKWRLISGFLVEKFHPFYTLRSMWICGRFNKYDIHLVLNSCLSRNVFVAHIFTNIEYWPVGTFLHNCWKWEYRTSAIIFVCLFVFSSFFS